ncbi:type 4b pilus protein PilO2 [Yersinia enterocolitica]|uniref:type 4b pilus protein PilO2 n=1 Tax=Yersinia enterocolitica TaxID=630 RepID=UPI003D79667B
MTLQTLPGYYSLQTDQAWLIAGLRWQYLRLRGRRNMRLRAREANANRWIALPTGDGQAQGSLLGTVNVSEKRALKQRRNHLASMALTVLPSLPSACYAVFSLPDGQFWFVAVSDGMLSPFGDIVGDETAMNTAVNNFLQISPTPQEGWTVYAPAGFFSDREATERDLLPLLDNKIAVRRALLSKTHNQQVKWIWGAAIVVVIGGYVGYSSWQTHLQNERIEIAQAELKARNKLNGQAPADSLKPWAAQPNFPSMLDACNGIWKESRISLAGLFKTAICDASGKITFHYILPMGVTVGDFAARVLEMYGTEIKPVFNIPGAADDGSFSLPVILPPPKHPEALLSGDLQIQRLTSYAQRINANMRLSEMATATQLTQGEVINLPWRTLSFTFVTDIPPDRLFAPTRFDSSGIRASSITTTLKNNRLVYTIEGVLYANR